MTTMMVLLLAMLLPLICRRATTLAAQPAFGLVRSCANAHVAGMYRRFQQVSWGGGL